MSDELKTIDSVEEASLLEAPLKRKRALPFGLSRFDATVLAVIAVLLAATTLTIVMGDHIGTRVLSVGPVGRSSSTSPIFIQFSEEMDEPSINERLRLEPEIAGNFSWNGRMMIFTPTDSVSGRQVLSEYQFSFTVSTPRIAYLSPADSIPQNIWIADPLAPGSAQQVTFSPTGIYDFSVSPDGTQIAFSEIDRANDVTEIKILNLETGELQQITNCAAEDSTCDTPTWRPDGNMLAYQRMIFNSDLQGVGVSPTRVWLLDLSSQPYTSRPLFSDSQVLSYSPQWSGDGSRIAVFDSNNRGIAIFDFNTNTTTLISSQYGSVGSLSPDGQRLVFPEMLIEADFARSYLKIADMSTNEFHALTQPEEPIEDRYAVWHPDGRRLAIGRRYLDDRFTRGSQVYLLDTADGSVTPLVVDARYANGFFSWDPTGEQLVIQRFPELDENGDQNLSGRPEVWIYNLTTGALTMIAQNANRPQWVP
jgi:Tol biopolymer transport system component